MQLAVISVMILLKTEAVTLEFFLSRAGSVTQGIYKRGDMRLRQTGFGLVGLLGLVLSIPLVLIGLAVLGFISTLIYQAYWDSRVEEMCEKDGGRTIYERIVLSDEEYGGMLDDVGRFRIPTLERLKTGDGYFYSFDSKTLERRFLNLVIKEASTRVIRVEDRKIIAEQVRFMRIGGDFPFSASQTSSFVCPKSEEKTLIQEVFIIN